jgi:hypothetical protein
MGVYLIRGPFMGKGNREYVICEVDGKRKKINYARYLLMKSGIEVKSYQQVHHKDGNKNNNDVRNLEPMRGYVHDKKHTRERKKK